MNMLRCALALLLACLAGTAGAAGQRIGDFALLDHEGKFHQLSWYGDHKAIVLFVQGNGCPIVRNGAPTLRAIRDEYAERDVAFFMLNPQPQDDRESIAAEAEEFGYDMPILVDEAQLVAESLGVDRTSETFIIDPASREIVYRGPIDDRLGYETQKPEAKNHYLKDALDSFLAGESVAANTPEAPGCLISFPARDRHRAEGVSYSEDVAPILVENCVNCHSEGGIGPWAMTDHKMIQGWSRMMKEVLMTRRMPPGQIDPHVGRPIRDMVRMEPGELQTLVHWIDAGAPVGEDEDDPIAALDLDAPKWSLGEPDLVYKVEPQDIPATGLIDYRYIPVELNLDRDVWIRGMEFVPGDREVLHHVIAYASTPADKSVRNLRNGDPDRESVGGYAPGRQPDQYGDSTGRLLRKGTNLLLQMHYTTSGKETVDATEIGIYLHDEPPDYFMSGLVPGQRRFLVPPGAKEHELEGVEVVERDAWLYSMMPHMHYRGKYMSFTAEYPDGSSELLLSVPKYEFNWQFNYILEEPVFLPAGTRLVTRGAMDNSDRNPANPDPNVPVRFGLQTRHEMFFGFTSVRYEGDTPESLQVAPAAPETNEDETSNEVAGL